MSESEFFSPSNTLTKNIFPKKTYPGADPGFVFRGGEHIQGETGVLPREKF